MYQTKPGVQPRLKRMPNKGFDDQRVDRISVAHVGIESVLSITSILNTTQIDLGLGEKKQVAVKQRHTVGLEIGNEIKHFWCEKICLAERQTTRKAAQFFRKLGIGLHASNNAGIRKVFLQCREFWRRE